MSDVFFEEPLRTTVVGLLLDVFATDEVLQKISRPIPHDKAQAVAKLIGQDLRAKMGVNDVALVMAGGLVDAPVLADEDLDIITALEHCAEQFMAIYPDIDTVAMTEENGGLLSIQFPQLEFKNPDGLTQLPLCLPLAVVSTFDQLEKFEDTLYKEDKTHLHFTSDEVVLALIDAFGLQPGELMAVGYEDLDAAEDALGAYTTNAKLTEVAHAVKNKRQAYQNIQNVPVFVMDGRVRVGFFSFDFFARRLPHLQPGGPLEEAYEGFVRDYHFLVEQLTEEGLSPWCIHFPSSTEHTDWASVQAAPRLNGVFVEDGAPGLLEPAEGPSESLDLVCMTDPEGALIAATLTALNEDEKPLHQTNIYPLTYDGQEMVFEYAKAVAQRMGLNLSVNEGPGIYINEQRRVLATPPLEGGGYEEDLSKPTLH